MGKHPNIPDDEAPRADRAGDAFFAIAKDAFADPATLDQIPEGAHADAISISDREPGRQYDVVAPHTVAHGTPAPTHGSFMTLKRPSKEKNSKATQRAERSATGDATHPVQQRSAPRGQNHQKRGPKGR